jgi:hypothetical protein
MMMSKAQPTGMHPRTLRRMHAVASLLSHALRSTKPCRTAGPANAEWAAYVARGRTHTRKQRSSILRLPCAQLTHGITSATAARQQCNAGSSMAPSTPRRHAGSEVLVESAESAPPQPPAYILRTYQVPPPAATKLLLAAEEPGSRMHSIYTSTGTEAAAGGQLMLFGCTAMGQARGAMVELWRFDSSAAALAAEGALAPACLEEATTAWRQEVGRIAPEAAALEAVALLRPTKWSLWQ